MSPRIERLQIMLELDELKALDNFRFKARMPSRAAAVRELIRRGLSGRRLLNGQSGPTLVLIWRHRRRAEFGQRFEHAVLDKFLRDPG